MPSGGKNMATNKDLQDKLDAIDKESKAEAVLAAQL
jgi:hypothetical protein